VHIVRECRERSGDGCSVLLMKGLDQFRMSLGGRWLVLEQGRVDAVVVGFVGGAFWKGQTLCPFGILFP
jgi:hypothetical protein